MGKLPCSNIENVESQIKKIEMDFNENKIINMDLFHKLNTLYQTAVEYFSAINSPKFQIYTEKIKNLMANKQINELICKAKEENNIENFEKNIQQKERQNEKEEKIITQGLNKIKSKLSSLSGKKEQKKELKKIGKPKVTISKEDEDGGTLDVGSDDEDEEDEDEEKDNLDNQKYEDKNNKEEKIKEEKINEEVN